MTSEHKPLTAKFYRLSTLSPAGSISPSQLASSGSKHTQLFASLLRAWYFLLSSPLPCRSQPSPTAESHPILQVLAQMLPPPGNLWGLLPKRNSPPLQLQRDCGMSLWSCEFNEGNAWPLLKKGTALLWPHHRVRPRLCIPTGSELTAFSRVHGAAGKTGPRESKSLGQRHTVK